MSKPVSGTNEWSVATVNCLTGCSHDCRYCYARANALRFKRIASAKEWAKPKLRPAEVTKKRKRVDGRVMFPSTHDILPEFLDECTTVLRNLLGAGNDVLIVSKPHLECIRSLCHDLEKWLPQILFRFTIGSTRDDLLSYWEPGAPYYFERRESLALAYGAGYATSVSCEPFLGGWVGKLYEDLSPLITDTIWFGKMNKVRQRVLPGTSKRAISEIEQTQTDEAIAGIYEYLKDEPRVRWKESYKQVLGLDLATEPGTDK